MIKITNGVNVFEVTNGAFKSIYETQGYKRVMADGSVVEEEPVAVIPPKVDPPIDVPVKSEDDKFIDALLETPLSSWDKGDIKRFAAIMGVDISGTKNADEAKERIKDFMSKNG